ncbi:acetyl-CoA carboxylase biotin carboxyl carrier protein [Acidiphilium sp. AL]|uniref:Biotin carboxyl carrier protein of acetyl-CoA carboxylase n=1 Tax=Acidiphilium iwatense TaxID=768198 RepID=A0ABS9DV40_9PROT|nr:MULTISPECIES: acetyl-CoA carboxylase biotin carboxyl carrier protein [Acidiphilium]MCF3945342.1 acetyl-CoA carboxylase biotin carboxyl carrier protein [Acidiphilium iwatense]MCU4159364.1 acetyl-CoA carboxylase biotin carboxyl carrier protein [Acidiphilium sp. AL]
MSLSFDPEKLRELAALLNESGLAEIELEEGDRRLRLARAMPQQMAMPAMAAHPAPIPAAPTAAATAMADFAAHPGAVKSPMVGVAYLAPEPNAPPFISVGQSIEAGQTLLLIEAMKTFNQIKAPRAGTVRQILISAGQPVEYDEPLVILE